MTRRADRLDQPDGGQLGIVGRDYHVLQNKDAFKFLDPIRLGKRAMYHTVGALDGGRKVWLLVKLPGEIKVVGDDITEISSHQQQPRRQFRSPHPLHADPSRVPEHAQHGVEDERRS